jgi:hypothetical protein
VCFCTLHAVDSSSVHLGKYDTDCQTDIYFPKYNNWNLWCWKWPTSLVISQNSMTIFINSLNLRNRHDCCFPLMDKKNFTREESKRRKSYSPIFITCSHFSLVYIRSDKGLWKKFQNNGIMWIMSHKYRLCVAIKRSNCRRPVFKTIEGHFSKSVGNNDKSNKVLSICIFHSVHFCGSQ